MILGFIAENGIIPLFFMLLQLMYTLKRLLTKIKLLEPFFLNIGFSELAALGTLFTGLVVALLLAFSKKESNPGKLFLSAALVAIVLKVGGLTPLLLPALGPLLHFYVRQLTNPGQRFNRKDTLYFYPLLAGYWLPVWLVLVSVIIYLYFAHRLIQNFYARLQPVLMDRPRFAFRRLEKTLLLLGLVCILSLFSGVFYFAIAIMLIGMSAEAILNSGSDAQLTTPITDRSDAREKGRRLKETVAINRLYEDAELTLATLAVKLMMHPHDLSRIINVGLEKNFSDFINEFRVREVARKMSDPAYKRFTILGIAYESGFSAKTTFNRVFKEMTGKTPVEYKNDLNKEVPIDKSVPQQRIRPVILRPESPANWASGKSKRNFMFSNYLKIAWRNLVRHRLFSLVNIFGLATGMACTILILLWVQDEHSYDKFNTNAPQLYRLTANVAGIRSAVDPTPIAPVLKQQLPAVKDFTRLEALQSVVTIHNRKFEEKNIYYADPGFLQIFDYPLLQGNKANVLSKPDGMVITQATAKKYFGNVNAIGQVVHIDDDIKGHNYVITGVLQNIPHNSHLQFDILLPFTVYEHSTNYSFGNPEEWGDYNVYTYLLLNSQHDAAAISSLNKQITSIHTANDPTHTKSSFTLQPLTDIHLHSNLLLDVPGNGNAQSVSIFSIVAIFILLIACINFMNLSTALSGQRAKEVGLRKTVGALRGQLIVQFLGESLLLSLISLVIGVAIAWLLLPMFNNLAAKNISVDLLSVKIIFSLLGVAVFAGLLSGSYPALFLSAFNPIKVLKGMRVFESNKTWFRNGLVVFQFSISVILIISTLVVNNQLLFIRNRDIGFNKENLLYLEMPTIGDLQQNFGAVKTTLSQNTRISNYTLIEHLPTDLTTGTTKVNWNGKDPHQQIVFPHIGVDGNFIRVFGLHLLAGRTFEDNNPSDAANYILNETAVKTMGLTTATAIGKQISMNDNKGEIIGVVKDFNFKPVQQMIQPLILRHTRQGGFIVTKANPANLQQAIAGLKASFSDVYHDYPFSYGFVDQDINRLYRSDLQMGELFNIFSVVSILISCLGLFGLSTFATQRRIKEIGIRRVLGANSAGLVTLLARDFVKLVLVALIIGFPIAWWVMNKWLDNYVYRTQMNWWIFAVAGLGAVLIALITVSFQSIKAALANPVKSLRSE